MIWAITVLIVTIGLIVFSLYKVAKTVDMGYTVRRLEDDQVVARFGTHWAAEQWLDEHCEDDAYYLDD